MKKSLFLGAGICSIAIIASGCATLTQGSHQTILFDSNPTGAKCNIASIDKNIWPGIPAINKYDHSITYSVGEKSKNIWLSGVHLDAAPEDRELLYKNVTMPSALDIKRSSDLLIITCKKQGYQTKSYAYLYKHNPSSIYENLLDPTWVVGHIIDSSTGAAYLHPPKITVTLYE